MSSKVPTRHKSYATDRDSWLVPTQHVDYERSCRFKPVAHMATLVAVIFMFAFVTNRAAADDAKRKTVKKSVENTTDIKTSAEFLVTGKITNKSGQPAAGAKLRLFAYGKNMANTVADNNGRYELRLSRFELRKGLLTGGGLGQIALLATAKDNSEQTFVDLSMAIVFRGPKQAIEQNLVLKPTRKETVRVVDGNSRPVKRAHVSAVISFGMPTLNELTDQDGRATLVLPSDAPFKYVYAFKSGLGFDIERGDVKSVSLELNGARKRRVRVHDDRGFPVTGVTVRPQYINVVIGSQEVQFPAEPKGADTPDRVPADHLVIPQILVIPGREFEDLQEKVDDDGVATFDWIPKTGQSVTGFVVISNDYFQIMDDAYSQDDGWARDLTLRVVRKVDVTGVVQFPDGRPGAGVWVTGSGTDSAGVEFYDTVMTDKAGRFTLKVRPDLSYLFTIFDGGNKWGASPKVGITVRQDPQQHSPIAIKLSPFVLKSATRVFGQVLTKADSEPVANGLVSVIQIGQDIRPHKDADTATKVGELKGATPSVMRLLHTDADGRFQISLGPGDYAIVAAGTNGKLEKFSVEDQPELEFNVVVP